VAHEGLRAPLALLLMVPALGCAGTQAPVVAPAAPAGPPAVAFPDDTGPLPRFHSTRLALYLPLPDGKSWRIDDHTRPELVATHAPTQSTVKVAVVRTDGLVGRNECEALARDRKLVPPGELHTLESTVDVTQDNYDTRIWVAIEPGSGPGSPVVGHVMAFGRFLRKCYLFDFSTRVDSARDEAVLSDRLAFARARILGGLQLEVLGVLPRQGAVAPGATGMPAPAGPPPP
jgi:hypothetical protein